MSALATELVEKLTGEREKLARYTAIAVHCPIPAFVIDVDVTKIVYVNPAFVQFTGYTLEEVQGSNWLNILHEEDRLAAHAAWNGLKEGHPVRAQRRYITKSGQTSHGISIIERVEDNGFVGFILPQCGNEDCPVQYLNRPLWRPRLESHQQPEL